MTDQTAAFVPPAAENLPPGVLDSATDGASALDAWAREPAGRNFLAHALVQLARAGWLLAEPGEGFEVVRDRGTPEPTPAGQAPATDRTALRDRIRRVLCDRDGQSALWGTDMLEPDEYGADADAVLAVLPAPAEFELRGTAEIRAAVLREAVDRLSQVPFTHALTELRRMADEAQQSERDCPSCEAGLAHTEHCPTPETHNAGCGCPSDVAAAIASCPGYEMSPSPCRCPCYGCKHHCAAHDPADVEARQPSLAVEDCTCIPVTRQGGVPRYCQPGDTVDMISGWEIGGDCPHHRDTVKAQQPARHIPCPDAFWLRRPEAPHDWQQRPDAQPVHCRGVAEAQQPKGARS